MTENQQQGKPQEQVREEQAELFFQNHGIKMTGVMAGEYIDKEDFLKFASSIPTEEQWGNLIDEFYQEYRRYEKDPDEDELPYARGVRVGKGNTYANVVHRMRELSVSSAPPISHKEDEQEELTKKFYKNKTQ